jgi:conjugal transfer pilus assembly protein TraF
LLTPILLIGIATSHADGGAGFEVSGIAARSYLKGEQDKAKQCTKGSNVECGWWFKLPDPEVKPNKKDEQEETPPPVVLLPDMDKTCRDPKTWQKECGFINPDKDFDFQSKQREALLNWAVMEPESSQAVFAFQKYNQWMINQALMMSKMWEWNMTQHPELDPKVARPVAQFALGLFTDAQLNYRKTVWESITAHDGMIVWWTRSDCEYCHSMLYVMQEIEKDTGIPIWNASLDGQCMPGYENRCLAIDQTEKPAQMLQVSVVPSIHLYLADRNTWIRVSNGMESQEKIISRITVFFESIMSAVAKGMQSDGIVPAVDFSNSMYSEENMVKKAVQGGMSPGIEMETNK